MQALLSNLPLTNVLLVILIFLLVTLIALLAILFMKSRRFLSYFLQFAWRGEFRHFERFEYWPYEERLFSIIARAESENAVELSWGAREMLVIPIIEQFQDGRPIDWREIEMSIIKILDSMREDHSAASESRIGRRNAVAVIRAFFKRFCNIPPFCSPNEDALR